MIGNDPMGIGNHYMASVRKAQENWLKAFETFTTQARQAPGRSATTGSVPLSPNADPHAAVNEYFDLCIKVLEVQRETTQKVISSNIEIAEQWQAHAAQLRAALRDQMQAVAEMSREQGGAMTRAAQQQAHQVGDAVQEQVRQAADATVKGSRAAADVTVPATESAADATEEAMDIAADATEESTEKAADAAVKAVKDTTDASVGATDRAATATTNRNYNLMNQTQLKAELASRKLATTGSLDEMRARLREHDKA